jgi:hypothetical protein
MIDLFRALAVHQAHFHKKLFTNWGAAPGAGQAALLMDGLLYDATWLTKFPLLHSPGFGIPRADALNKAWQTGAVDAAEAVSMRTAVDADLVRFVLKLRPEDLEARVELFFGGRAMNKPLWNYLVAWLEHGAGLRNKLASTPGLFDTVFS